MRRAITAPLTRVRQRSDIAAISFDASAALAIHGRERRIGHNHCVAEGLEVLRHPLTLGGGLQQNPHWAAPFEHGREAIARRRDASVEDLTTLRNNPDLTVLLMQIDGTILHGWSSPVRLKSALSVMWSANYHLTEETSGFIVYTRITTQRLGGRRLGADWLGILS